MERSGCFDRRASMAHISMMSVFHAREVAGEGPEGWQISIFGPCSIVLQHLLWLSLERSGKERIGTRHASSGFSEILFPAVSPSLPFLNHLFFSPRVLTWLLFLSSILSKIPSHNIFSGSLEAMFARSFSLLLIHCDFLHLFSTCAQSDCISCKTFFEEHRRLSSTSHLVFQR